MKDIEESKLSVGLAVTLVGCIGLGAYLYLQYTPIENFFISFFLMVIVSPTIKLLIGFTLQNWGKGEDAYAHEEYAQKKYGG